MLTFKEFNASLLDACRKYGFSTTVSIRTTNIAVPKRVADAIGSNETIVEIDLSYLVEANHGTFFDMYYNYLLALSERQDITTYESREVNNLITCLDTQKSFYH